MWALPAALAALVGCTADTLSDAASPPQATILSPTDGQVVDEGEALSLLGTATDAEHGAAALAARWYVNVAVVCGDAAPAPDGTTECASVHITGPATVKLEVRAPDGEMESATCWDGVITFNDATPDGGYPWCTYKSTPAANCTGGGNPGSLYVCNP